MAMENEKSILEDITKLKPVLWKNSKLIKSEIALKNINLDIEEIYEVEARIKRFAAQASYKKMLLCLK